MKARHMAFLLVAGMALGSGPARAQGADPMQVRAAAGQVSEPPPAPALSQSPAAQSAAPAGPQSLSIQEAEKIALENHPQIQIAQHRAAYAAAQVKQVQSAYFPQANGSLTGVKAETDSRIAAGLLNNPIIYDRFAAGASVTQYVTDFGRTQALVRSSGLHARAQQASVGASQADVLLQVREAYYAAQKSSAVLRVAEATVKDRKLISDQVAVMAQNKLKSGLDVAFANVDLGQAQLLLIQAQNDLQASYAQLSAALGYREPREFDLPASAEMPAAPGDFPEALQQAIQNRPELASQRLEVNSAKSYATAERDLWLPTMSAAGAAGLTPYRAEQLGSRYAAAGFNVNIPLFNGHLFGSLRTEANEEYRAQQQTLRDLEDRVARDVRTAWLNANSAFQRLTVTEQVLSEAKQAEDLASSRYRLGLSSIVELSQGQLNLTQAQIAEASARYDYCARVSELLYQQGVLQ